MEAGAASKNAALATQYETIDSLLPYSIVHTAALDLEQLRAKPEHPPFSAPEFETPMPSPQLIVAPPEPTFVEVPQEKGLFAKKHHAQAVAAARADYEAKLQQWQEEAAKIPAIQLQQMQAHQKYEADRQAKLASARSACDAECQERERVAQEANDKLDTLIVGVARNDRRRWRPMCLSLSATRLFRRTSQLSTTSSSTRTPRS
jgi:restriction system protein